MIISLTGTPGTGKTTVAENLKNQKFSVINLNDFAIKHGASEGIDPQRKSAIINIVELEKKIKEAFSDKSEIIILDSHLSHLLSISEKIILLRCHPNKLKIRLSAKGWNEDKIKENLEAEILDVILCETNNLHEEKNIFEIDTTNIEPEEIAEEIIKIISTNFLPIEKYSIGHIDWTEILNTDDYFKREI